MRIEPEDTCIRHLAWRVVPAGDPLAAVSALVEALRAAGWPEERRAPGLLAFPRPGGHRVLVVPATGRVQIRLHYTVPEAERPAAAQAILAELAAAADAG